MKHPRFCWFPQDVEVENGRVMKGWMLGTCGQMYGVIW